MKMNKMVSLDTKICERLIKEKNASSLIEALLIKHYEREDLKDLPITQLKEAISLMEEKTALDIKLEAIMHGS